MIAAMSLTHRPPGIVTVEHEFDVPLDHARPDGEQITVSAREVAEPEGRAKPFLVFLQGGPGSEAPRPTDGSTPGWLGRALKDFRVLMLDQRGTGRSSPIGTLEGRTPQEQADYLTHFRADSIVKDAELIREALGVERWSVLGQSFGGLCVMNYLSVAPDALREVLITGGVPTIERHVDEVFTETWARTRERTLAFYERYPEDRHRVRAYASELEEREVWLPEGDRLTARRLRMLGNHLGMSDGPELLHYRLELPFGSPAFLHDVQGDGNLGRNPLWALLNEACWGDGYATNWSGRRTMPADWAQDVHHLTGEHFFPWMYEDFGALQPLAGAAEILATHEWPRLYDQEQLRRNEVPAAAIVYFDDPYVPATLSLETAAIVPNLRPWVTNEYLHNGLRADGARILDRLLAMARGGA
jgi:pimeloyl-ACP methyl ester carboxylesterase